MTHDEAMHIARVVCLWSFDNKVHKDRTSIRKRAQAISPVYTVGVEAATAEYILERANPVDKSFLK